MPEQQFSRKQFALAICLGITSALIGYAAEGSTDSPAPILHLDFQQSAGEGKSVGSAELSDDGPSAPRYPDFGATNRALHLPKTSYLRLPDSEEDDTFDFENGDAITVEAWVNPQSLADNAYIIGKGRTGVKGSRSTNQNWAMRLRKQKDQACVNFLFRSRADDQHPGDWHRWTSKRGFAVGSGWHHVAIRYRFGDPDSIRGFIDGKAMDGSWDMGGATNRPPVVDEDDVWIGSAMDGASSNSFDGLIDELAVYREEVPDEVLESRYRYVPREIVRPAIPEDAVLVEMFGPHGAYNEFPEETDEPQLTWQQDAIGLDRLPAAFDSWGVRDDWTRPGRGTMLLRFWSRIHLPPGDYQFMVRSRGLARLIVDGAELVRTPAQRNRGGAHHVVDPIPPVPVPGMRPHYMNDHERMVAFHSDGGVHELRFEVNVGSTKYCLKVGETVVAVAAAGEMFQLVSPAVDYPLTDDGWLAFVADNGARLDGLDAENCRLAGSKMHDYWQRRHDHARQSLISAASRQPIDAVIEQRIAAHNRSIANAPALNSTERFYLDEVQPILSRHCYRCHGEKQQGGLNVLSRDALIEGGDSGDPALVPGDLTASHLWALVSADQDDYRMPPEGNGLTAKEQEVVARWIREGAPMPSQPMSQVRVTENIDDATFLRRVFLDTIGLAPTLDEIAAFFADPPAERRQRVIDRLLDDPRWADNWVGYWQDVLAENPNLLKPTLNNTGPFRYWIRDALADNKPLDRFATELIMMRGSQWTGGTAGFGLASQNDSPMAAKAHVIGNAFLGVEMKCARCHDAPFHDWNQRDLFQMAAMLQRKPIKLPESSTVPAAFFEDQARKSLISATIQPGTIIETQWPFPQWATSVDTSLLLDVDDSREKLAFRITSSRRFAEVMANRLWKRLMGSGIVEPVHDWHGNPPSDPALLATLADALVETGYDQKAFVRKILLSDVYQRTAVSPSPQRFFAGPARRRMAAEQIVDSALHAVGLEMRTEMLTLDLEGTFPPDRFINFGYPKRSWEFTTLANERDRPSLALPRAQAVTDVLQAFGWRNSRPEPLTTREQAANLIQPGVLANGTFGGWLTRLSDDSGLTAMMLEDQTVEELVERLFWRLLTRQPTAAEHERFVELLSPGFDTRRVPEEHWGPAPERPRHRYVSWSNHLNTEANKIKIKMEQESRRGDPPTRYLEDAWRQRGEDAVWSLVNSPEMILIP